MQLSQLIESQRLMRRGDIATIDGSCKRTWAETADRIACLASALSGLGIAPGDRVAILALNSYRYFEAVFAVGWIGAVIVPLNTRLAPPEIKFMMEDADVGVVFVDNAFVELANGLAPELDALQHVIHITDADAAPPALGYEALIAGASPVPPLQLEGSTLAGLFYTGGTTGRSKGVMLSHDNLMINALQSVAVVPIDAGRIYLHTAPMFHIADFIGMLMHLIRGGPQAFMPGFEPVALMELIAAEKINLTLMIPTMIGMLVNHPDIGNYDLSSLEYITYGGSPISEGVLNKTKEMLPGIKLGQAYGQTEASPILTILDADWHNDRPDYTSKIRSGGRPVAGVEIAILDDDGNAVEAGEIGEICSRGPNTMIGYWKLPDLTEETLRGGWLHTGDSGYIDDDGFLFIVDRVKDMIVTGGENVYSSEVESAISQFDGVIECAVIGIPHDQWGEQVHAVVRLRDGVAATEEEIINHCHALIAGFKCPKAITFRDEPLPLSGAGKVLKRELRAPYWEGRDRAVG